MKKQILLLMLAVFLLASCAPQSADVANCVSGDEAGFLLGLWHGIIAPITFIISLFSDTVKIYEVNNSGGWYDFGFVLGAGILFGGSR